MNYFLRINGQMIGPMQAHQIFAYNVNPNIAVSTDGGYNWRPLYSYPELMQIYHTQQCSGNYDSGSRGDSNRILCGIMAILFGTLGIQYFIIGKVGAGFLTILLSLVTCGVWEIITFIQGIMMLCMTDGEFRRKYVDSKSAFPLF